MSDFLGMMERIVKAGAANDREELERLALELEGLAARLEDEGDEDAGRNLYLSAGMMCELAENVMTIASDPRMRELRGCLKVAAAMFAGMLAAGFIREHLKRESDAKCTMPLPFPLAIAPTSQSPTIP